MDASLLILRPLEKNYVIYFRKQGGEMLYNEAMPHGQLTTLRRDVNQLATLTTTSCSDLVGEVDPEDHFR